MKNKLSLFSLLLFFLACRAQEPRLLIGTKPIDDLTAYPIYKRITEERNGEIYLKSDYSYVDSIDISGISYWSDGLDVRGMLVKPKKPGLYPCVIYNRGGNREFGSLTVANAVTIMGELAKEGYIVIASQYRGNAGGEGQEEFGGADVNDVTILTKVLQEVEGADTSRIGMYGWSRGGMMTYIALTKTNKIKAAVVGGAVSDSRISLIDRPGFEDLYLELIPNYASNKEAELDKRSAVKWVDKFPKDVPILLLHGNADWRVKPEQSLTLALQFEKYRVPYRLVIFEGGDHGLSQHKAEKNKQVISWFDRFLKNGEALPNMEYHGK